MSLSGRILFVDVGFCLLAMSSSKKCMAAAVQKPQTEIRKQSQVNSLACMCH